MEVRNELLNYGILPISLFLPKFETTSSVAKLHSKLLLDSEEIEGKRGMVDVRIVQKHLKISQDTWDILLDTLETVAHRCVHYIWPMGSEKKQSVDCHAFSLFLFSQVYGRQAFKQDSEIRNHSTESKKEQNTPQRPSTPTRVQSLLTFPSFIRRHIQMVLYMALDRPPAFSSSAYTSYLYSGYHSHSQEDTSPPEARLWIMASEIDRLGLLLRHKDSGVIGNGDNKSSSKVPGIGEWARLSSWMPFFNGKEEGHQVPCEDVISWLVANIMDSDIEQEILESRDEMSGKVIDITKGTVVRGEDKFPNKELIVSGCQDSCVYALAPLSRAKVSSCTDCTLVIGPVSGCLIAENCTRLKLVCACKRILISSCHDSEIYLGTNRPPVLFGDNRFLQLAPYNTTYDKLQIHIDIAGLSGSPNLWDKPIQISAKDSSTKDDTRGGTGKEPSESHSDSLGENSPKFNFATNQSKTEFDIQACKPSILMPPDQLLPFTVPFKGGSGSLAGGSSKESQAFWTSRSNVGRRESSLFALSKKYEDAMNIKLQKVSELQDAVGKSIVDLENRREVQVVIQSYFKDWLFRTGRIRQVYDLARLEQRRQAEAKTEPQMSTSKINSDANC